ncbi:mitochondrial glycerol-3-phosphate dehydrogenase, partial [Ascosphaera acerosa]
MAARHARRLLRPFLLTSAAAAGVGGALYFSYRPINVPGSQPAAVPPPAVTEAGHLIPPRFPRIKSRAEQLEALKRSGRASTGEKGGSAAAKEEEKHESGKAGPGREVVAAQKEKRKGGEDGDGDGDDDDVYDLLVIGAGATGSGIALDAATRGLKVALVERDDFSSGTSSKSTKL